MKMVAEYLERAMQFEHMAAVETSPALKALLLNQAEAADYRDLAAKRATELELRDRHNGSEASAIAEGTPQFRASLSNSIFIFAGFPWPS